MTADMTTQTTNPELQLANDFVRHTGHHLFLTGKAGTGKTTFLHQLKQHTPKRMIVTAPTGVAAINAGGVTLHSFFQLPFGPYLPGSENQRQAKQRRFSKEKTNIIRSLDLLVIDEISMVRADVLDGVDAVLRRYRHRHLPFGGVQLLMIGDLHQLAPVVKDDEWELLKQHYETCYFFSSNALKQTELVSIELKTIYRQSDAQFIHLLNRVRDNHLDGDTLQALNTRHIPDFRPAEKEDYITLTTHNRSADSINERQLQSLGSQPFTFEADIEGDYPAFLYPTAEKLILKKGAQVMFVRNDSAADKRYFNGKIGKVIRIDKHSITVKCPDDESEILVEPLTWENIKYSVDAKSREITEQVIGSFTQYPLRLAWAITIHKSQGLTFERAIIDAHAAFSHGQVYVALSRCRSFEGMVLSTPISQRAVKTDTAVAQFVEQAGRNVPTREQLDAAKNLYQQRLLLACFDYQLQERVQKASQYFSDKLQAGLVQWSTDFRFDTDNKEIRKQINKALEALQHNLAVKTAALQSCRAGFTTGAYLNAIAHAAMDTESRSPTKQQAPEVDAADVRYPALFQLLKTWREEQAKKENVEHYRILHQRVLIQIAEFLPDTPEALLRVKGIGKHTAEKYGAQLTAIVSEYTQSTRCARGAGSCREHGIEPQQTPPPSSAAKQSQKDTKQISYALYLQGNSIEEIAAQRELTSGTIETHLAHFVGLGQLDVAEILPPDKITAITHAADAKGKDSLKLLKEHLGDDFSYGEIRLVLESLRRRDTIDDTTHPRPD